MTLRLRTRIRDDGTWRVWRGRDPGTGRMALVKEVRPDAPHPAAARRRLAEEVRFFAGLDHPNVLPAGELDPAGDRAVFGDARCSLAGYLAAAGPLPPAQVANVLAGAAAGLEYLHARRRGHGCVSLDTLLVGPDGGVLLGDFLGAPLGGSPPPPDPEPKYLAPELVDSAAGRWGPTADLYGLGFAALELLAGDRFDRLFGLPPGSKWLSWHGDVAKELADWRALLPHAPTGLLDLIAGLIPKPPAARAFPTAAALRAAVERSGLTSAERLAPYRPAARPGPRRVGPFALTAAVHGGPGGRVYRGTWAGRDGREAAVRVFPRGLTADPAAVRALVRGLAAAGRVRDRHLVRVFGTGAVPAGGGAAWYVATEYARGGSLADRLAAGPLSPDAAVRLAAGAARGLAALHAAGAAHGRLDPGCVLFGRGGRVLLTGYWGLPPAATRDAADLGYRPPEQRTGGPTPAADVYALGAVLAEVLTGDRPARADPRVPAALAPLIAAATHPDPAARPPADEFARRLAAVAVPAAVPA